MQKYAKEQVVLVGRPGSGKSTALARLLLEEAQKCRESPEQESQKVPVLVELRYWKTSVISLIGSFFYQHNLWLDDREIEELLFTNRLLLLVDGLNELPSEDARHDLRCFRQKNKNTPMIFTTRDLNVGGALSNTKKLQMQPLSESQMRDFVNKYLLEQGDLLLQQLSGRLWELGQTPLLLNMLCSVFKNIGDVRELNLGLVFHQFIKGYKDQRLQNVLITEELRRWWEPLLKHLALKMTHGCELTQLQVAISRQEAEDIFTSFLQQEFDKPRDLAMDWLQKSLDYHLIQIGAGDKIEFRHQLIQEYYTAESLLKQLPPLDDKLKREYLNYLKWTEPLALMLELVKEEKQALRVVELALEVDFKLAARLAGSVKPEFQEKTVALIIGIEIGQKVKVELLGITGSSSAIAFLQKALQDEDSAIRSNAVEALANIGNEEAVDALIQALQDEDYNVRSGAVQALENIGNKEAVDALIQALQNEDYDVRGKMVKALGSIGNKEAVDALIQALQNEDSSLRSEAVAALSRFDNSVVINNLVQALNKDENSFVRRSAAKALGNIRSEIAIEALAKALKNDKDSSMRLDAAQELSSINNDIATEALEQALKDEHSLVRCEAAEALVKVGNKAAINTLIQALYDEDSSMRRKAVALLSKVNHETAINALVQVLNNDRDFSVRLDAAKALGSISNNKAAINALEQALHKDKVSDVRWCAAQELGRIGNESAIKFLVQALKNKKFDVRLKAFSQLEAIDNEIVVAALIQGLHDKVDGIRWCAVSALGRISNEAAIEALVQALNNENFSVRWRAAEQLGKIDDESGIDVLVEALIKKEDDQNRRAIADVLGRFNNEVAINALIQALKNDGDFHVRWSAVRTLGRRGNEAAINALVQALKDDSNFHLRSTIASILGGFDNKAVINALIEALKDEDSVRHSALQALGKIAPSELLPQFLKLLQINGEDYLLNTISAIQERCKYYNYTLTQSETPLQPQLNVPVSVMHILHLSDLHFGTSDNATNWYNQLANDLIHELERPPLNALILSGDIANKSTPDEYTAAKEFLDKLCKEFHLQKEQVIIVPGNHDLNWEISKKEGYKPLRREEFNGLEDESLFIDSGGNYIEVLDPEQYKRRFEYFSNFYKTIKGTEYPTDYDRQYTLDRIDNLLILGLNSAWQLDHHYKARASIKPAALSNAFEEIRRNPEYQNCQKIAVWHHPINSSFEDRIKDSKFLDQLAINGFRLFLHGHLHETQKGFNEYDAERGLYRICAGTFGAPTKELPTATAWQYHLLKFEGDKVTVRSRKRQSETGAWESDSCWRQGRGKHSLDWYEIQPFET